MKKLLLLFVVFQTLILLTASCVTNKEADVIRFWGMGVEGEAVGKLVAEFEKENPGVKVKVQMIPWTAAQEKLISAYASGNLPDVFQLGNTWIPQFKELDALEKLNGYVLDSKTISQDSYFPGIWETNVIQDGIYGIPWYIDTRVLFYRVDDLQKAGYSSAPASWKELYEVARKIKSIKSDKNKYPIFLPTNDWSVFVIFGMQAGADLLTNDYTYGHFNSPEFKRAVNYLLKFYKNGLTPKGFTAFNNIYQAMAEGYISMFISGPWNIKEMKKWMKGNLKDKWMTSPLPAADTNGIGVSLAGGSSIVMNSQSGNKHTAWKLIEFLSRPAIQLKFFRMVDDLPARREAWESPEIQRDKFIKAFFKQLNHVKPVPKVPEWERIAFSKIQKYMEYIVYEKMSVETALKKLDEEVNSVLEKRRWLIKHGRINE